MSLSFHDRGRWLNSCGGARLFWGEAEPFRQQQERAGWLKNSM